MLFRSTTVYILLPAVSDTTHVSPGICAAILAGGKSSRMGTDKALMGLDGMTMIEKVLQAVPTQIADPTVITNNPEDYAFLNLPLHRDVIKGIGPLGGIYTALKHCKTTHCLIVACDLPFLNAGILHQLSERGPAWDVLVVDTDKGVEPLCAVYSKHCLSVIQ